MPTVLAHRQFMDENKQQTLVSQCKLAFTERNVLMAREILVSDREWKIASHFLQCMTNALMLHDTTLAVAETPILLSSAFDPSDLFTTL